MFTEEAEFVPIKELLSEDNEKVKEIKSLFQRETEYLSYLGPFESFFAYFYLDNPRTKDSDVIKAIKNVKLNYYRNLDSFDNYLDRELIGVTSQILRMNIEKDKRKITRHELFLILNHILWAIDNRSWINDSRAYLKWICNFFGILSEEEKKEFDDFYDKLGEKHGISKKHIETLKTGLGNEEIDSRELALSQLDSKKFSEEESGDNEKGKE